MSGCAAAEKLDAAQRRTGSLLSIGLEPSDAYLPSGWDASVEGHARFLRLIIESTADIACAFKPNLAFFEALGAPGWAMLEQVRAWVPTESFLIADGKRGDIGSTAERYADAIYGRMGCDAATVNPLMGSDALDPFLAHGDRLTFVLALTSNPGAADFLGAHDLWRSIITKTMEWSRPHANAGFVVGATRGEHLAEARRLAGERVLLVPGVGAQGGDIARVVTTGTRRSGGAGVVIHVTRGVLPTSGDSGRDPGDVIREKTLAWNARVAESRRQAEHEGGRR